MRISKVVRWVKPTWIKNFEKSAEKFCHNVDEFFPDADEEVIVDVAVGELNGDLGLMANEDDHDCHASEEDGCEYCYQKYNQ